MTEPIEPAEVAAKLRAIARELPGEVVEHLDTDELEAGAIPDA